MEYFGFAAVIMINIALMMNVAVAGNISSDSREVQALVVFGWPYMDPTADHCEWKGINCDAADHVWDMSLHQQSFKPETRFDSLDLLAFPYLTAIALTSCGLHGYIPHQIGFLSKLTYLSLYDNLLYTDLPLSLANLTKLQVLDISYNDIYGVIPAEIGSLSNLIHLNLSRNSLSDELPLSLANLSNLYELDISSNEKINGAIPPEIGSLTNLTYLNLSNNRIKSDQPVSLAILTKLQVLDISSNYLIYGSIPSEFGNLKHMYYLDLSYNNITGSLPSRMSHLRRLEFLNLGGNKLEDFFEAGIEKLPTIKKMDLSRNLISGRIPLQFGNVSNAQSLNIDLSRNNLSGGVPISVSYFNEINLSFTHLQGLIL